MRAWLCVLFRHRYVKAATAAPKFYACRRCGEPGFLVPERDRSNR